MIECHLRPMEKYPETPTREPKNGQFKVGYQRLLDDLSAELERIDATSVVLELDIAPSRVREFRNSFNGWPKADTRIKKDGTDGVVLNFEIARKSYRFACDTYWEWQDNLRAISLTLEALRAVARYGATKRNEQYRGYEALPPPKPETPIFESDEDAARFILSASKEGFIPETVRQVLNSKERFQHYFRIAARNCHPDMGGSTEEMKRLNMAADRLKRRHGL